MAEIDIAPSPTEAMFRALERWFDCNPEDDEAYKRARVAMTWACEAWMRSQGWRPPLPRRGDGVVWVQLTLPLKTPRGYHGPSYRIGITGKAQREARAG